MSSTAEEELVSNNQTFLTLLWNRTIDESNKTTVISSSEWNNSATTELTTTTAQNSAITNDTSTGSTIESTTAIYPYDKSTVDTGTSVTFLQTVMTPRFCEMGGAQPNNVMQQPVNRLVEVGHTVTITCEDGYYFPNGEADMQSVCTESGIIEPQATDCHRCK